MSAKFSTENGALAFQCPDGVAAGFATCTSEADCFDFKLQCEKLQDGKSYCCKCAGGLEGNEARLYLKARATGGGGGEGERAKSRFDCLLSGELR